MEAVSIQLHPLGPPGFPGKGAPAMHMEVPDVPTELAAERLTHNTNNRSLGKSTAQQPTGSSAGNGS
ncbi:hypothetical protein GCM10010420_44810 [Streptomyces glaucosporus]|uniref:Uncharacterized protein n=1 Tax=Streptomyces glaucosporus TaxID=284044 RepID=A0ABN3IRW9_9ACTN